MEPSTDFHFTWDNHQATLLTVFDTLLANEKLADCTVSVEGKSIKAHKVILAACSPYFERVFTENHEKHPIIILPDVKFRVMKALLDFMYHGELNIQQDDLGSVLRLSESFQLRGLSGNVYISDMHTQREDGGSQLLISAENQSSQPTILSVFTLCSQETSEMEMMNSFEEDPRPHSSQKNSCVETGSVIRASCNHKKLAVYCSSDRGTGSASLNEEINIGVETFQISDAEETLPLLATETDESDCCAISAHPTNSQLQGSVKRARNTERVTKEDSLVTLNSALTPGVAFDQVTCSEGTIGQVAHETKFADQVGKHLRITSGVTLSGGADGNGSANHSDVRMTVDRTVTDVSARRGRAVKHQPVQSQKKCKGKRYTKFKCYSCGKSYVNRSGLVRHFLYECGKDPQFECPRCKLRFFRRDHLRRHMLTRRCRSYLQVEDKHE
ncbi:transcription factor GAGA-like [Schistocerca piceifrons]|uniref:transcription factor GAGA-like n=1 Tax=Schistocerca piceifrons TaxID=274613 RepID=UPI001F5F3F0B|nr:transcription factor GAGA-like [Schistocerca piceifrons]